MMQTVILDKESIKKAIFDFSKTDPEFLGTLLEDIKIQIVENNRKQLESIVNEDFKEYESVFRALA